MIDLVGPAILALPPDSGPRGRTVTARGRAATSVGAVGLFSRLRGLGARTAAAAARGAGRAGLGRRSGAAGGPDSSHLASFASSRVGVEAYVEPATNVTPTTILLIATDGEWTRRRVPSPAAAWDFARAIEIPVYDVNQTGYPQRMRDWTARQRRPGSASG